MLLMFNVYVVNHFFAWIPDDQDMGVLIHVRGYAQQFLSAQLHFHRIDQMEEFDVSHAARIARQVDSAQTFR